MDMNIYTGCNGIRKLNATVLVTALQVTVGVTLTLGFFLFLFVCFLIKWKKMNRAKKKVKFYSGVTFFLLSVY